MLKIVDGIPFVGKHTERFSVRAVDLGNGHIEASASRHVEWEEADWSPEYLADVLEVIRKAADEEDPEERRLRDRQRAARRAKTRVRRLCKAMGADTLLTLTYRALETDLSRVKADLREFNRRMVRLLPGFRFVACFELQKRGAWHVHIATAGIPTLLPAPSGDFRSYNVIRAIWRSVTKDRGGNIDVQRRKRASMKTAAAIASYIAKYIGKTFAEDVTDGKDRWTKYGAVDVPQVQELGLVDSLLEAIQLTYDLVQYTDCINTARLDHWRDWFFVAGERQVNSLRWRGTDANCA